MPSRTQSPFAALERTFRMLASSPPGLVLDARTVSPSAPARTFPLSEVRDQLRDPTTSSSSWRTAVLGELSRRARTGEPVAVVAYAGVLLPELRRRADQLTAERPRMDPAEAEALVLGRLKRDLGLPVPVAVAARTAPGRARGGPASHGHGREHDAASA